ncbi:ribonuclease HII [Rhizobium sp. MHM7A]|uniref:ribonuclease HII n=1 Tax=Rhizobium sp. MHM7A TaxID=2583233 RepID=UPI001106FE42|nr:ribonuclease HII [Rhizobium sp. MHM7A]TLX15805.1 ribonuclease HII [Rhizobium sp. MHM7A]
MPAPDFSYEQALLDQGIENIAGIDEVGRGPLGGPVVVSAVILDPYNIPEGLRDSKQMSAKKREAVFDAILQSSYVSIASISAQIIDKINIREATLLAMTRAANGLEIKPGWHLIDGNVIPKPLLGKADFVIKGDAKCLSISAASIVAKVTRDRMMERAAKTYPGYGFEKHAGYGTPVHLAAIAQQGPCPLHRMSFRPLKQDAKAA